jgi:hypothetical protein
MLPPSFLLDVVVSTADWAPDAAPPRTAVWLVFTAESIEQPFSTPQAVPSKRLVWHHPFRLVLNVADISVSYLFISMCTYDQSRAVQSIARCRIPLGAMPRGSAKMIRFPMLNAEGKTVCTMRFRATISRYRGPAIGTTIGIPPFVQAPAAMAMQRPMM